MVHQIRRYWPTIVFLKVWRYQKVKSVARRLRKSIIDQTCASARACLFRHGMKYVVSMWNTQCFLRKVRERDEKTLVKIQNNPSSLLYFVEKKKVNLWPKTLSVSYQISVQYWHSWDWEQSRTLRLFGLTFKHVGGENFVHTFTLEYLF